MTLWWSVALVVSLMFNMGLVMVVLYYAAGRDEIRRCYEHLLRKYEFIEDLDPTRITIRRS